MKRWFRDINLRREALWVALAAAEASWVASLILASTWHISPHPSLGLWLGVLTLLLGFFYTYRALTAANLDMRLQQGFLVAILVFLIALVLRFHVYANAGLQGAEWILEPFRRLSSMTGTPISELVTLLVLIYLWARGIHLARRSLSVDAVGLSFRGGVVVFVWTSAAVRLFTDADSAGFIPPFFFFGLLAAALSRVEEVSRIPGSRRTPGSSFWIGAAVATVALVVAASSQVAVFFYGGGLESLLRVLSPLFLAIEMMFIGAVALILGAVVWLISFIPLDFSRFQTFLAEMMLEMRQTQAPIPLVTPEVYEPSPILGAIQASVILGVLGSIVILVLLFTWWRLVRDHDGADGEARESMFSARLLADNLKAMLRASRDRLAEMAGLVDRFGLGTKLLSAISIRRIYINLVRLATREGYPRVRAQTPYEYLDLLGEVWPDSRADLIVITDAYVSARYGQMPDTREDLERIRACWEHVLARNG